VGAGFAPPEAGRILDAVIGQKMQSSRRGAAASFAVSGVVPAAEPSTSSLSKMARLPHLPSFFIAGSQPLLGFGGIVRESPGEIEPVTSCVQSTRLDG
jgi:hypothetical protein